MFQAATPMPDIPQPTGLPRVEPRGDGRSQGGGAPSGRQPKQVVQTYQEADRAKPSDDRVTVLGIPMEQITASTRAALAGLVAENATLRALTRRLEARAGANAPPVLDRDAFIAKAGEMLIAEPGPGLQWVLVLIHVQTYEDIRRSSGLLAANTVLADVGHRLRQMHLTVSPNEDAPPAVDVPLSLVGSAGGLSLAVLAAMPGDVDPNALPRQVREGLGAEGYDVAGLSMALSFKVAASTIAVGESALLALARVDHLTRGPSATN